MNKVPDVVTVTTHMNNSISAPRYWQQNGVEYTGKSTSVRQHKFPEFAVISKQ